MSLLAKLFEAGRRTGKASLDVTFIGFKLCFGRSDSGRLRTSVQRRPLATYQCFLLPLSQPQHLQVSANRPVFLSFLCFVSFILSWSFALPGRGRLGPWTYRIQLCLIYLIMRVKTSKSSCKVNSLVKMTRPDPLLGALIWQSPEAAWAGAVRRCRSHLGFPRLVLRLGCACHFVEIWGFGKFGKLVFLECFGTQRFNDCCEVFTVSRSSARGWSGPDANMQSKTAKENSQYGTVWHSLWEVDSFWEVGAPAWGHRVGRFDLHWLSQKGEINFRISLVQAASSYHFHLSVCLIWRHKWRA